MPTDTVPAGDGSESFYKAQERIYPKRVSGRYRNLKWIAMVITLGIYYLVPFLRFDRGPNAPDQAVLIDMERGRAYWFWLEIWPQEVFILTAILIFSAIALFFVTSLFGRVWCGYYCPQTVWTDLFVWVERVFQGDRNARKKLREGPWTFEKVRKVGVTHLVWLAIAWATAGSFVLYFNDAPTLVQSFLETSVSTTVLVFIIGLTFSTYLMAGFAREQVCIYMCPYSRFQSAMFDKDTLIIGYDEHRGEPRGKFDRTGKKMQGDCIDCSLCVQVCPTGIDIREGLQLECIACGLCADACDGVMEKLDKPKGLVGYETQNRIEAKRANPTDDMPPLRLLRGRSIYYMVVLTIVAIVAAYAMTTRSLHQITAIHDRAPLFVQLSDGNVRNGYDLKILNKTHYPKSYSLRVDGLANADIQILTGEIAPDGRLYVPADTVSRFRVFVAAEPKSMAKWDIQFHITQDETGETASYESIFFSARP